MHLKDRVELPPRTETLLPAKVRFAFDPGIIGLIEPNRTLSQRYHVCAAATLVKFQDDLSVPVRLLYPTTMPIALYENTVVGCFNPLDQEEIRSIQNLNSALFSQKQIHSLDPSDYIDLSKSDLTDTQKEQLKSLLFEFPRYLCFF